MFYIGDERGQNCNAINTFMPALSSELQYILTCMMLYLQSPELMTAESPMLPEIDESNQVSDTKISLLDTSDRLQILLKYFPHSEANDNVEETKANQETNIDAVVDG